MSPAQSLIASIPPLDEFQSVIGLVELPNKPEVGDTNPGWAK